MSFTASVRITDLDDYISPAAECIIPIKPVKSEQVLPFSQISEKESTSAKITLNDCLACSGCITSAETVLINQHSIETLNRVLDDTDRTLIFSISPQSCASIAARFNLDLNTAFTKLTSFLKLYLKASHVLDAGLATDISLLEQSREFCSRYKEAKSKQNPSDLLPLLTSECPGWICYAEKTQGSVLPYISTVRSAQQVLGAAVKRFLPLQNVYHVCIMPCFDKKLEAARSEFDHDVDLVLSTSEISSLIEEKVSDLNSVQSLPLQDNGFFASSDKILGVEDHLGSGSYLSYTLRYAAKTLFNMDIQGPLTFKPVGRNADFQETCLMIDGVKVLRFAYAYGFRNIQNLVRKINSGSCPYHFVEVMACPSGCLNGGGQIRSVQNGPKHQKELLGKVTEIYQQFERHDPESGPLTLQLHNKLMSRAEPDAVQDYLHTSYRAMQQPSKNGLLEKW